MRLVLSILLLPLFSPAQVAEDVATLDILSEGRVVFGVGLGYRNLEYQAFNVDPRSRVSRFLESLELVKRLWTEEDVYFEGEHFQLSGGTCTVRPVQKPYPPIWMAANSDRMVRRAGRLGYPWLLNPHVTLTTLERQMGLYRQALSDGGHPMPEEVPVIKELHVALTHEEAIRVARPYVESKYESYAQWGQDQVLPGQDSFRVSFDELARDRFILGSVEEVIEQIEEHHHRLGANHFLFRVRWPGMEAYHAYRVVELMGDHVLPYFRKKYG
jgi:alkanesulfonate monooxygenase SsuD/methylene tetrahydromethanopterin reductase-like flavin-dependent oxidoreductase (luciferase family)